MSRPAARPGTAPQPAPRPGPRARPAGPDLGPVDTATVRSAVRLLREPFWARVTLVVVLLSVAFFFLGRWQLGRHEGKVARNRLVEANYNAAPVPLDAVLPAPGAALAAGREWTRVQVAGTYDPARQLLIRNRPLDGNYGFEVIVPLRLTSGATLLVDRGWVPAGERFITPDAVPVPPNGEVTVVARVRPGEPPLDRTPPPGQELRIDLGRLAAAAGGTVYRGAYAVLATETPAPATAPTPLPEPDEDLGPHLAYAVQWWIGDVAAPVLLGWYALAEARLRRAGIVRGLGPGAARGLGPDAAGGTPPGASPDTPPDTPPGAPPEGDAAEGATAARGEGALPAPAPAGRTGRLRARRRPHGPTDEEWEDALTDHLAD